MDGLDHVQSVQNKPIWMGRPKFLAKTLFEKNVRYQGNQEFVIILERGTVLKARFHTAAGKLIPHNRRRTTNSDLMMDLEARMLVAF